MKAWTIIWKDTLIRLRDRNALLLYLAAPLILSAIMGAAFSGISTGASPVADIPLIIVNEDEGEFGDLFVEALTADTDLDELLAPTPMDDLDKAIQVVETGDAVAVVYIPADFSSAIRPSAGEPESNGTAIQLYTDPTASVTPNIARGIVAQLAAGFSSSVISAQVTVEQLVENPENLAALGPAMFNFEPALTAELEGLQEGQGVQINLNNITPDSAGEEEDFNFMAFFAPSMAIFFVMFSVVDGSRSILDEKQAGTLDRLVSTPTSSSAIILGKIGGTFLTGFLQMSVLVVASLLLFNLSWGQSWPGLVLMMVATVAAATSLGTLIAGFAKQPSQVQIVGTAVILISSTLGGNFIPAEVFPDWLRSVSLFTLNRWAMDGFSDLTVYGLGLSDILPEAGVLMGLSIVFFGLGVWQFQRRMAR